MAQTDRAIAPPQNLDAEESVLGAMLLAPNAIDAVVETVQAGDFYRRSHGLIFQTAVELFDRGEPVDPITLVNALDKKGQLAEAGGDSRIKELAHLVPATANAPHYARIVRDAAVQRRLIDAGQNIARLGWEKPGDPSELMEQAEKELTKAVGQTIETQFASIADGIDELTATIREAQETGRPKTGLLTGFSAFDNITRGLHPGQLILVAARPGMGKSALAQNIAENIVDAGSTAAILTLEMSRAEVLQRSVARASGVETKRQTSGALTAEEKAKVWTGIKTVEGRANRLFVEDSTQVNATTLRAQARRLHRRSDLGLLVVDYLQLMLTGRSEESRQVEVSSISRGLKMLARELEIPVLALSQLNRKLDSREDKRPMLSDLRDSGALEQDADVVAFIYRDNYYNPSSPDTGIAEVIVAKNRQGERGTAKLAFVAKSTTFKPLPEREVTE